MKEEIMYKIKESKFQYTFFPNNIKNMVEKFYSLTHIIIES